MSVQPNLEAEYQRDREKESLPRILRVTLIVAVIVSAILILGPDLIIAFIATALWGGVLALRYTSFGKANPEACGTAVCTIGLFTNAIIHHGLYDQAHTQNDKCNSMNITNPSIQAAMGKNFSDIGALLTGGYCADIYHFTAGWNFWGNFAHWLVFTLFAVLLLRLRFKHCLIFAGLPGLLEMAMASEYLLATGFATPVGLVAWLLVSYVPGMIVCLMAPHITERLHFANWVLHRAKDSRLKEQSNKIKDQSEEIQKTKKQLADAQKVVDDVMARGGTVLDHYAIPYSDLTMGTSLGEGSFGTVYKASLKRGAGESTVAVKTMRVEKVTKTIMDKFRGEICIMAPLFHPNLVRLYGAVWNEGPDKLCIVLEYVENGSLLDVLTSGQGGTWANPRSSVAHGIAKCFRYLHHELSEPLIHRDLKPANVLITSDMQPKVADFGESKQFIALKTTADDLGDLNENDGLITMTFVGTELYMAPEIVNGNRYNKSVFAFSLVLLELAVGNPFHVKNDHRRKGQLAYASGWRPPIPALLLEEQPELVILIEDGWATDPSDRPEFLSIEPRLAALKPDSSATLTLAGEALQRRKSSLLSTEEKESIKTHFQSSSKKFSAFLSHHKVACAAEARLVKLKFDTQLGKESFLDSDNLRDLRELLEHVIDSDVLVLFQSKQVLQRPWCLLELYTAVTNGVPIVAINVVGKSYDFTEASDFLTYLETSLKVHNPDALNVLSQHNVDPLRVAHALSSVIPLIISLPLNSSSSKNMIDASLADLAKAMAGATARPLAEDSFDPWLAARTSQEEEDMMAVIKRGTERRTHHGDTIRGTMRGRIMAKVEQVDDLKTQLVEAKAREVEAGGREAHLKSQLEKKDAMIEKLMAKVEKLEEKLGY